MCTHDCPVEFTSGRVYTDCLDTDVVLFTYVVYVSHTLGHLHKQQYLIGLARIHITTMHSLQFI